MAAGFQQLLPRLLAMQNLPIQPFIKQICVEFLKNVRFSTPLNVTGLHTHTYI